MTHDDVTHFAEIINQFMRLGGQDRRVGNLQHGPISMRVPECQFPGVLHAFQTDGFIRQAQNSIRNLLAITMDMSLVNHGQLFVREVKVIFSYFHFVTGDVIL